MPSGGMPGRAGDHELVEAERAALEGRVARALRLVHLGPHKVSRPECSARATPILAQARAGLTRSGLQAIVCGYAAARIDSGQDRLDVDHRRSVDGFKRADSQSIAVDLEHLDLVEPDRVRAVR